MSAVRLPWRRPTGARPSPAVLPARAWTEVAPLQRVVGPIPPVAPRDAFTATLTSWRDPSFLAPLGHLLDADAPAGVVHDLARPVERSTTTDPLLLAPRLAPPRRGLQRVLDALVPLAKPEPALESASTPVSDDGSAASVRSVTPSPPPHQALQRVVETLPGESRPTVLPEPAADLPPAGPYEELATPDEAPLLGERAPKPPVEPSSAASVAIPATTSRPAPAAAAPAPRMPKPITTNGADEPTRRPGLQPPLDAAPVERAVGIGAPALVVGPSVLPVTPPANRRPGLGAPRDEAVAPAPEGTDAAGDGMDAPALGAAMPIPPRPDGGSAVSVRPLTPDLPFDLPVQRARAPQPGPRRPEPAPPAEAVVPYPQRAHPPAAAPCASLPPAPPDHGSAPTLTVDTPELPPRTHAAPSIPTEPDRGPTDTVLPLASDDTVGLLRPDARPPRPNPDDREPADPLLPLPSDDAQAGSEEAGGPGPDETVRPLLTEGAIGTLLHHAHPTDPNPDDSGPTASTGTARSLVTDGVADPSVQRAPASSPLEVRPVASSNHGGPSRATLPPPATADATGAPPMSGDAPSPVPPAPEVPTGSVRPLLGHPTIDEPVQRAHTSSPEPVALTNLPAAVTTQAHGPAVAHPPPAPAPAGARPLAVAPSAVATASFPRTGSPASPLAPLPLPPPPAVVQQVPDEPPPAPPPTPPTRPTSATESAAPIEQQADAPAPALPAPAPPSPEELARTLFDPLLRRLRAELRLERERRGLLSDLRH